MKTIEKPVQKTIDHPMEDILNIEPNTTVVTHTERETELSRHVQYDDKDNELEDTYQEIYDKAIDGHQIIQDEMETAEPKYLPRLGEVSVAHLNVALNAAAQKARLKEHKDKMSTKKSGGQGSKTINNTVLISREALLEQLKPVAVIDVEHNIIEGNKNENE